MGLSDTLGRLFGCRMASASAIETTQPHIVPTPAGEASQRSAASGFARPPRALAQEESDNVEMSEVPDSPDSFSYNMSWFAIRSQDFDAVAHAFDLIDVKRANWRSGLAAARFHRRSFVFVSPSVSGWVLAVGCGLPYPVDDERYPERLTIGVRFDALMQTLMTQFPEVGFFGTDRRCDFNCWVHASGGAIQRAFCLADGGVLTNRGPQSAAEQKLQLVDLGERTPEEASNYLFECMETAGDAEEALVVAGEDREGARKKVRQTQGDPMIDEDHTLAMAAAWTIDPMTLSDIDETSVGLVGVLPPAAAD